MKFKRSIVLGVISLLLVIVGFTAGCFGETVIICEAYNNSESYVIGNTTYDPTTVTALDINWYKGRVKLVESANQTLNIIETGTSLEEDKKIRSLVDNGTLYIQFWASGYSSHVDGNDKQLTLEVPASLIAEIDLVSSNFEVENITFKSLDLDSISGNIEMGEVSAEALSIESVSGNINADKLTATTIVDLDTTSGNIDITAVDAQSIDVDSISGRIILNGINAKEVEIDATSGDVSLSFISCDKLDVDVISSKVNIALNNLGATVTFNSLSGKLDSSIDYTVSGKNSIFGDGKMVTSVRTASGNLSIE